MLRLSNIKIREDISDKEVVQIGCKKYNIDFNTIKEYRIYRKSIDARNKRDVFYNYTIDVKCKKEKRIKNAEYIDENEEEEKIQVKRNRKVKPIIVGAGPAGLFCALTLVDNGIYPIIIEQGNKVEQRTIDVNEFLSTGKLNVSSNVQFGEGGAGTFSDGKLTTGLHNSMCRKVLKELVRFGAPKQIMYLNKPHIGTDNLINIIACIREYITKKGGEFIFGEKVTNINITDNKVTSINCSKNIETDTLVLAIGHSARDTFEMLYKKGFILEQKNFSVGVRIEHKQKMINESQYGNSHKLKLPPAEYKLVYHGKDRTCYTFCMCPGGTVMASSSEIGTIVTNGMSKFARDGENANSAILVEVTPKDFKGESPLEGMYFQKQLEEKAFELGGKNYYAPIQRVEDFIKNRKSTFIGNVKPTYKPGVTLSNLNEILPDFIAENLKEGIINFNNKLQGFADNDAILTGVETRSSSPIRIKRNEKMMSSIYGVYPCGEGAGYAGGIMSAAVDGIKCAKAILEEE